MAKYDSKRKRRKSRDASGRKSRINQTRYRLKENLIGKVHESDGLTSIATETYEKQIDGLPTYTEAEMDNIIQTIVRSGNPVDTNEPFVSNIIPTGKNSDKTIKLYNRRKYYKDYAWPKPAQSQNIMDEDIPDDNSKYQGFADKIFAPFQFEDLMYNKTFYGRIDTKNYPVYPSNKFLKPVMGTQGKIFLVNFVADAANAMIRKINTLKNVDGTIGISNESAYYQFKVERGWVDFKASHHNMVKAVFEAYVDRWATDSKRFSKIINFKTFSEDFVRFLDLYLPRMPLSRTNLLLHKTTSPLCSGIMFEISKAKHDDDKKKYTDFILDKHFLQIQSIANGFGFMVDKNAPWRFIADLESVPMRERMAQSTLDRPGFSSLQQMFDAQYYHSHKYEGDSLRNYFLSFYDSFVESYPYYSVCVVCGEGSKTKLLYREARNRNPFTDKKYMEFLYFLRAKEAKLDWSQERFDIEVEAAEKILKTYGFEAVLDYINDKTTIIVGKGANFGNRIKKTDGKRIIYNHEPSYKRTSFTMKF